jgi:hypothetical protein
MNLFYFNGANEIRRLEEVTGQYAVVSNLSTKINDKMIFGIYTKSESSFFTTRITHSFNNEIDMVAGGRYLLFWGDAPTNLYPNLPRIDLTDVVTTGPANPLEEVLAVSLNTDSGATAGDLSISIEVLGVLFNGESRSYNLLGSPTEYETLVGIRNNTDDIKYKTNLLEFYNESGINELMTYDRASESNLIDIKNNSDKLKYTGDDLKTVVSNTGFDVNNQITGFATETTLDDIKTNTSNLIGLSYSGPNLTQLNVYVADGYVNVTSLPNVTIGNPSVNYSLESGGNLQAIKTATEATKVNSDKNKYFNDDLKVVFSNTGIAVNTISGFALETTTQATNTKLDTLNTSVNNKTLSKTTSSIDISGQTVAISNTGFNVNNQISGFALDSSITTANGKLDTINTSITNKTLSKTTSSIDISGQTVAISNTGFNSTNILDTPLITGFATETTLAGIKTQTDKLIFVGDDLKSVISNTSFESSLIDADGLKLTTTSSGIEPDLVRALDVNITNATPGNPLSVTIDPTVVVTTTVNNFPTTTQIVVGGDTPLSAVASSLYTNLRDTTGAPIGVNGNPIFVSSSGSTADGKAYLYNGLGNTAITATNVGAKEGIDTNIINSSIDTHCYGSSDGTTFHHLKTTATGNLITESKTHDGSNIPITSSLIGSKQSLDVNVANTTAIPVSGTFFQATQPISGTVGITGTVPVSGTFFQATQPVSIASTVAVSGTFYPATQPVSGSVSISGEVNITEDNRVLMGTNNIVGGLSTLTSVNPAYAEAGVRALHTLNYNQAYNNDVGIYLPITSKSIGSTYALNCYNIKEATKEYTFGGIDNNATAFRLIGGNATSSGLALDLYNYGLANPRVYYASLSTGTPNCNLFIDYIDGTTGNLVESAVAFPVVATGNTTNWTLLPSMIGGPIKFRTSASIGDTVNTANTLYISPVTNTNRSICSSNLANYGVGVFTIPNGYIGYITAITAGYATAGSVIMVKWDVNGIRQVVYKVNVETSLNIVVSAGYEGMLGGIFTAGESIAFTNNLGTAGKLVQASITLRPI